VIDRSETRDTPWTPLAAKVAGVSGTCVAETILASVHVRARKQAGHMDASDLSKSLQKHSCEEGAVHIWGPDADRRDNALISLRLEG
jgi:hypothetical protein